MLNLLAAAFGRPRPRPRSTADGGPEESSLGGDVRFRPRLAAQISHDHDLARQHMRALLDACRAHDEDAEIAGLRRFADAFRRNALIKSVQLYPYLRRALERDRVATLQLHSTQRDVERANLLIEAVLTDYLEAPWESDRRRRFVHDVVRVAQLFSRTLKQEESALLPLYLPPGQYRFVAGAVAMP